VNDNNIRPIKAACWYRRGAA